VSSDILKSIETWAGQEAWGNETFELAGRFNENFKKIEGNIPEEIIKAAPKVL